VETRGDVTNIKGDVSLQFGHDLSAVETEVFNSFLTPSDQLQFGHDLSAVETFWRNGSVLL
jgi:hypothetical protein